jgi:flagellar biosynthesis protein FlhF
MKYFSIEGETREELKKKLARYAQEKLLVFKFTTEEIPQQEEPSGLLKKFKKPKESLKRIHRAYCGLPESSDEVEKLEKNREKQKEKPPQTVKQTNFNKSLSEEAVPPDDPRYEKLTREMEELKNLFTSFVSREKEESEAEEKDFFSESRQYLLQNDFSLKFCEDFLSGLLPVKNLETFKLILKEKMKHNITISTGFPQEAGRFFLLMGPTGVGKTTTLAKLAAIYFFQKQKPIRFITFDTYRLGASKQLEKYAEVFDQPFHLVQSADELKTVLKTIGKDETVWMDTAGESVKKEVKLSEIQEFLAEIPEKVVKALTLSANAKSSDLQKIKDKFGRFSYDYYIISKLDETETIGPIVETLYKDPVPVAFLATGQEVPEDIKEAEIEDFLKFL